MNNSILFWNVKGLNSILKQNELSLPCQQNNCGLLALLETKFNKDALHTCHRKFFPHLLSLDNCDT